MEVSYKRQFSKSYMVIKAGEKSHDIYQLMIITYNKILELLPIETTVTDGEISFWYDITGRQTLSDYLERKQVDSRLLLLLFQSLENAYKKLQEYLLEENQILLKPEYIYMDFEHRRIEFVYLPGWGKEPRDSFQEMMELLLRKLNHGDKKAATMAYEMYQLSLQSELSFSEMMKRIAVLKEETGDAGIYHTREQYVKPQEAPEEQDLDEQEKEEKIPKRFIDNEKLGLGWIKRHKFVREEKQKDLPYVTQDQEITLYPTEILNTAGEVKGILMYQGEGLLSDIKIHKEIFLIGKKKNEVDGYIDRKSVSRIHAKIEIEEDRYYIEDLNSTNGTYLNGERLEYRQKVILEPRDRITFGAEEYIFL